jgi:hypothetical protein
MAVGAWDTSINVLEIPYHMSVKILGIRTFHDYNQPIRPHEVVSSDR